MAARCASSANDELRSFRACLAWLYVDHSSSPYPAAAGSWADFLLAVAAHAAGRLLAAADDGRALLRRAGGLCRLLYFGSLRPRHHLQRWWATAACAVEVQTVVPVNRPRSKPSHLLIHGLGWV
ncbi:hypothetical protein U9M48_012559 [Paspalum notatum var. saurae]|uniref:Uncharacterized protein n=1 Tax=Paspalum notatum var. saurae TaxID=547442 RepID=A0AAQ3SXS7_PASNO